VTDGSAGLPVLDFPAGLAGFPAARHFLLVRLAVDEDTGIFTLRCLEDPDLQFVVADPARLFPDYAPEVDDTTADRVGLSSAEDALLLVVLTLHDRVEASTANLAAPLVVNRDTRTGVQAVLTGSPWALREPLTRTG